MKLFNEAILFNINKILIMMILFVFTVFDILVSKVMYLYLISLYKNQYL